MGERRGVREVHERWKGREEERFFVRDPSDIWTEIRQYDKSNYAHYGTCTSEASNLPFNVILLSILFGAYRYVYSVESHSGHAPPDLPPLPSSGFLDEE